MLRRQQAVCVSVSARVCQCVYITVWLSAINLLPRSEHERDTHINIYTYIYVYKLLQSSALIHRVDRELPFRRASYQFWPARGHRYAAITPSSPVPGLYCALQRHDNHSIKIPSDIFLSQYKEKNDLFFAAWEHNNRAGLCLMIVWPAGANQVKREYRYI